MLWLSRKKKELNISEILKGTLICQKCEKTIPLSKFPPFTLSQCPHCQEYNFIPSIVRNYCIFKPLGGGGVGCVYKAYDIEQKRYVSIKTLQENETYRGEDVLSKFLKEYAISKKVSEHPNLCKTYDFFELNGYCYMVLEFIDGNRLDKIINIKNLPKVGLVVMWGLQILSALQYLYNFGYLYRDLKPQNILITDKEKRVKIVDFGLACKKEETGEKTGIIEGSPEFNITPERFNFAKEDMCSEIYGLGMLMYFCLTGKTFYKASTVKALISLHNAPLKVSDMSQKLAQIDISIVPIIDKMIKKNPSERYQTYKEVYQSLKALKV